LCCGSYDVMTPNLRQQKKELHEHLAIYGEHYDMDEFHDPAQPAHSK
jgi:hypothetical protein